MLGSATLSYLSDTRNASSRRVGIGVKAAFKVFIRARIGVLMTATRNTIISHVELHYTILRSITKNSKAKIYFLFTDFAADAFAPVRAKRHHPAYKKNTHLHAMIGPLPHYNPKLRKLYVHRQG